jgi:hypothetical protein
MWHAADDWIEGNSYISNLYNSMSDEHDFAMPEVKLVDRLNNTEQLIFSDFFTRQQEKKEFVNAAAKYSSYQFYSLFRKSELIKFWPLLWDRKDYKTCWEGVFVNVFNIEMTGVFVKSSVFVYCKNPDGWSSSLSAKIILTPFYKYSKDSFLYLFKTKKIKQIDKIPILIIFSIQHLKSLVYLIMATIKQEILKKNDKNYVKK